MIRSDEEILIEYFGWRPQRSGNRLYKIGDFLVEYSGSKICRIGGARVEYSGGRLYKVNSKRVEWSGNDVRSIVGGGYNLRVAEQPLRAFLTPAMRQHVKKLCTHT